MAPSEEDHETRTVESLTNIRRDAERPDGLTKSASSERRRLAFLQKRAQGYITRGMKSGNHRRVRRALRLLTLATERSRAM